MKKFILIIFLICFSSLSLFAESDFLFDGYGSYSIPLLSSNTQKYLGNLSNSFNGGANIEFKPMKYLGITAGASFFSFENKIPDIKISQIINGTIGVKGIYPIGDRFVASAGITGGFYQYNRGELIYSGLSAGTLLSLLLK